MSASTTEAFAAHESQGISYTSVILTLCLAAASYHYYTTVFTYFKRRGVRGPLPLPFVGSLISLLTRNRMALELEWTKRYGKLYGVFVGMQPSIVINDPEIIRQVCIKDFAAMPNHEVAPAMNVMTKNFIIFLQDDHWKRVRALQSPTFTSGKIKRMFKLLDRCADDLVLCFSEQLEPEGKKLDQVKVDVKEIYSLYTMDAITTAAYTIKMNRKGSKNMKMAASRDEFVRLMTEMFRLDYFRIFFALTVPGWIQKAVGFEIGPMSRFKYITDRLQPIVDQRKVSTKKYDDYLQILVDARLDDEIELNEMDEKENHHAGLTQDILESDQKQMVRDLGAIKEENGAATGESKANGSTTNGSTNGAVSPISTKVKLNDFEILSSAVFLLIVGLETTATLLTNCTYALAFHLDVQQRLYETIKAIAKPPSHETGEYQFDYETLTACEYLDAVISESLRSIAPVISIDRKLKQDYTIEKYNIKLKRGEKLLLAFYSVMNDPEYWPNPERFDPDRFMGDNKKNIVPGSYCPFGLGPRHCLGMRFSLTEAKLALAKVMMKYKFTPSPGTSFPPKSQRRLNLNLIRTPFVELSRRSS